VRAVKINVPNPSSEQIEHYLRAWDDLENYHLQKDALEAEVQFANSLRQ